MTPLSHATWRIESKFYAQKDAGASFFTQSAVLDIVLNPHLRFTFNPSLHPPIMCPTEAVSSAPVDASEFVAVAEKEVSAQEVAQATAPVRPSGPSGPYSGRSSDFLSNVSSFPCCRAAGRVVERWSRGGLADCGMEETAADQRRDEIQAGSFEEERCS